MSLTSRPGSFDTVSPNNSHAASGAIAAAAAVLVVQFCLVAFTFPIDQLLTDRPLFYIDGAYHWYQLHVARELWAQGRLTGFDPFFAAGNLGGVTLNASAKLPALIAAVFARQLTEIQAYKLYVFGASVLAPVFVALAARALRLDGRTVWLAAILAVVAWWATALRWYHTAGMVSFVFVSYLAVLYAALLIATTRTERIRWGRVVLLGLLGAFGLLVHPLFAVPMSLAMAVYLLFAWRTLAWGRTLATLVVVGAIGVGLNVPWIVGMLKADNSLAVVLPYQVRVDITSIPLEMAGLWRGELMGAKLYSGLFAMSVVAAFAARTPGLRQIARCSLLIWVAIAVFAAVGAALPGAGSVQPNRFAGTAYLFLLIAASIGVGALITLWRSGARSRQAAAVVAGGVAALSFGWSGAEVAREVSHAPLGHYGSMPPETRPVGDKSAWLVDWLRANTTTEGRILFETSLGRIHDHAHMAGYYATMADREFIGGPYPFMFRAGFWDDFAFGEPLHAMKAERLAQLLRAYNVGWIVVHSNAAKKYLANAAGVVPVAEREDLRIFRIDGPLDFFASGRGRIEARGINRLVLNDLDGADIVVRYHFVPGLAAVGNTAKVEPIVVPGALGPFVRVTPQPGIRRVELSVH